jgi:drug/metabolite transporter (DMT)-like permease
MCLQKSRKSWGGLYTIFWHNREMPADRSRLIAILQALFVTLLWSTSWVLIKFGLRNELPAITFAGLRYMLAFLCLVPFILLNSKRLDELRKINPKDWGRLAMLGILVYTVTQTAQYLGLAFLPAAMLNLILNLTPIFVGLSGFHTIGEGLSPMQMVGILVTTVGVGIYFLPIMLPSTQVVGVFIAVTCLGGNVLASLFGRKINREGTHSPLIVTFVSMGIGSLLMLTLGLLTQGMGRLAWADWAIVAWLAVVNTALAFTLWNHTLRTVTALESSIINSLMMPQIAVLALIFLKEVITPKETIGLILVGIGVVIVQLRRSNASIRSELSTGRPV